MKKIILNISFLFLFFAGFSQNLNLNVNYYKALSYFHKSSFDSALLILNNSPQSLNVNLLKANILFSSNDFANAILFLKELHKEAAKESSLLLSRIYASMGFSEESCFWLNEYFNFKDPIFYSKLLSFPEFEQINKTADWRDFWEKPRYSKKYEKLAEAEYLINSQDYFSALDILQTENFGSLDYQKNFYLSKIYYNLGDNKKAKSFLNSSLTSKPKFLPALELKYEISLTENNLSELYSSALQLLSLFPENPQNLLKYSEACFLNNKINEARYYNEIYCNIFSNDEKALLLMSKIYIADKDFLKALPILNNLITQNPGEKDYFILRGDAYYSLESWKYAREDYSMALDIDPNLPEILFQVAQCWHNMGFEKKACIYWQKAADKKHRQAAKSFYKYCR